jgi:putative photosynthetic complex assembly protein
MTDTPHHIPMRNPEGRDMIPGYVVKVMFALAVISLALVAHARLTGAPVAAVPPAAEILQVREIVLIGGGAQAVRVETPDGQVLADMAHGGFVTVIQNGLQRERMKHKLSAELPIRIVEYANGRLAAEDPETGWSVELGNFGQDNRAAFERLMAMK